MIITAMICLAGFVAGAFTSAAALIWLIWSIESDDAEFADRMRKMEGHYE